MSSRRQRSISVGGRYRQVSLYNVSTRWCGSTYHRTSNISRTLVGNKIVDHSDWRIACRRCSTYIFIPDWTSGFNILRKDNRRDEKPLIFSYFQNYMSITLGFFCSILFLVISERQNEWATFSRRHFHMHFLNENVYSLLRFHTSLFPCKGPVNGIPALIQMMVWNRSGDTPLSEVMVVSLLRHSASGS